MEDDKVTPLRGIKPTEPSKMEAAAATLERERAAIFRYNKQMAIIIRNEYDEYLQAGFTAAQAMKLVTAKITPTAK